MVYARTTTNTLSDWFEQKLVYAGFAANGSGLKYTGEAMGQRVEQVTDTAPHQNGNGGLERMLYVHEDIMGSVRYMTKNTGNSFAELEYDVWGAPASPDKLNQNDNGVFIGARFTNHTYDFVLDVYHAQYRFYDAANRTFMAEDPVKDGLNWYGYVRANPATFVDPLGLELVVDVGFNLWGSEEKVKELIAVLETLTDDSLGYRRVGGILNTYEITITERNDGRHSVGTQLVREIIDNTSNSTIIHYQPNKDSGQGSNVTFDVTLALDHIPTDARVIFQPKVDGQKERWLYQMDDYGVNQLLVSPDYINLAHELIHAHRLMTGMYVNMNLLADSYIWLNGQKMWYQAPIEELVTTGLYFMRFMICGMTGEEIYAGVSPRTTGYTENLIRQEHAYKGVMQRTAYPGSNGIFQVIPGR